MKNLLILIALAGLALAQDKAKAVPEVPKLELAEMKLTATTAQNVVLRLEMLKSQYAELLREKERLAAELEAKFTAVFAKAGARREDFDLDPEKGVFVRKEQAKK